MVFNPTYSDVFVSETQLVNIIAEIGWGTSAIVLASDRGPLTPQYVTNTRQFKQLYGPNNPAISFAHYCALDVINGGGAVWCLRVAADDTMYAAQGLLDSGSFADLDAVNDDTLNLTGLDMDEHTSFGVYPTGPGAFGNNIAVQVTATNPKDNTFKLNVFVSPNMNNPVEIWTVTKTQGQVNGLSGQSQYIEDVVNVFSNFIRVMDNPASNFMPTAVSAVRLFTNGADGSAVGDSHLINGWTAFNDYRAYPNVNILLNGGYTTPAVQTQMLLTAETRGDGIAVLDMPFLSTAPQAAITYRDTTLNANSSWGAIQTPWYLRNDEDNNNNLFVPPSGAKAARMLYASNNAYPWQASAGVNYGVIPNAMGLSYLYQDAERAIIEDPYEINPITSEPGYGICFQNDKTLQSYLGPMSYVSSRVLVIIIRGSIKNFLQTIRWEPNDQYTRIRVVSAINSLLTLIQGQRGLASFNTVCDSTNNTDYTMLQGQLIVDVTLQPVFPIEKIMLNLIITANEVQVNVAQSTT